MAGGGGKLACAPYKTIRAQEGAALEKGALAGVEEMCGVPVCRSSIYVERAAGGGIRDQ
jgi:hypothetical protein